MFKTFTWGQYAGLVFVLLAAYYLFVAAAYYRVEILALLKGKGRGGVTSAPAVAVAARPSLVGGSGSLIPQTALAIQPDAAEEEGEADKPAVTRPEEKEEDEAVIDNVKIGEENIDNINKLNREEDTDDLPGPQATDSEADFTVDVAHLADYLEDAAEGNITQEELVAQLPELDNSALLVAFFQSNAKVAQQLTSQYYVDVPEPVLD